MERVVERDGRALQRIVTLLIALAHVADRAGTMPFPVRIVVLAILRHAEIVASSFAFGTASGPAARGRNHRSQYPIPSDALVAGHHGPADAARLALSLRALALIIANCAIRALSSTEVPSTARRAMAAECARRGGNWRGPRALPAPDTS